MRNRGAGPLEQRRQAGGLWGDDPHVAACALLREVGQACIGDELAAPNDDDVVGSLLHLAHEVAREQDRPAFGGEPLQEAANPADTLGVEPVHRLIEDQDLRVSQERGGDAEALVHAQREPANAPASCFGEPDELEHFRDSVRRAARRATRAVLEAWGRRAASHRAARHMAMGAELHTVGPSP